MTPTQQRKADDKKQAISIAIESVKRVPRPEDVAPFRPSSAKSIAICPSWVPQPREDQSSTVEADEGTLLHKCCEIIDLSNLDGYLPTLAISTEQLKCVSTCLTYAKDVQSQYPDKPKVFLENKLPFNVAALVQKNGMIDRMHIYEHHADIFDYKFGFISVDDAEFNWQGWCYALAVWRAFPKVNALTIHFPQPRTDEVSSHTFTRSNDEPRLQEAISLAYKNNQLPPERRAYNFNPDNCKYCARLPICPAAIRSSQQVVTQVAPQMELDPAQIVDPQDYATLYSMAQIMETWARSVKDHTKQFMLAGHSVPGLKIQERVGSAYIPKELVPLVVSSFKDTGFVDEQTVLSCCEMSVKQLLDAYAGQSSSGDAAGRKQQLMSYLSELDAVRYQQSSFFPVKD